MRSDAYSAHRFIFGFVTHPYVCFKKGSQLKGKARGLHCLVSVRGDFVPAKHFS